MDQSRVAQLSAAVKALREHLQLLHESKSELLKAIQETDEIANELRMHLAEAKRIHDDLSA